MSAVRPDEIKTVTCLFCLSTLQETLEQKLSALQSKISQQHNTEISVEQFRETVKECLNVTELTPFILNNLISKIEIGCLEMVNGQKQQEVSVEWKIKSTY